MRWHIVQSKKVIETSNLEGHTESFEMSGERVSGIIYYGAENGILVLKRDFVFPGFRIQPNDTHGSYSVSGANFPGFLGEERFEKAQLSGILTVFSHTAHAFIKRSFYPSTTLDCFYEDIEIRAKNGYVKPRYEINERIDIKLGCEGYIYLDRVADKKAEIIKNGTVFRVIFAYKAYFANEDPPFETNPFEKRAKRIEELVGECDLTTGDDIIDTEFAFAKIRAAESIFRTKKGLIHCPGGGSYYAAVWCNDQLEYAAPWFAFTGDKKAIKASENAFRWYEPYMNDRFFPLPSSIVAEGYDYWNGAGDRGDAAMYLYGLSRYLLILGKAPDAGQLRALLWCVEYIKRRIAVGGAVYSDSDELEGRLSSGVNLSTASLAFGGLENAAILFAKLGNYEFCRMTDELKRIVKNSFENYFAADIKGYKTYQYHKGCCDIRAWNCLPVYMGVNDRADDTLDSIERHLWKNNACRSTEGENTVWDRSTLYYIAALFRAQKTEKAFSFLLEYSKNRLLGERVPYPVEAFPEGNMRQLSAESALYCRVITDGLLNIVIDKTGFSYRKSIPFLKREVSLKNIVIAGELKDIECR